MIGLQTIGYARPRQLIINGDFQCWQRGESISFNDSNTPTNGFKYFADMWCTYFERGVSNNFTFEKVDNGVKVTTNKLINVNQFLIESLDSTKDYIFIVSINDTIHTLTFKGQETKENEFIKHMNQKDTGGYNRFIIKVNNNDIINYTNLFEGDIALPHRKEDYAIALLRCRRKVHTIVNGRYKNIPSIFTYYNNYLYGHILTDLDSYTTVIANGKFTIYAISNGQGNIENIILDKFYFDYTHNLLQIEVPESLRSRFSSGVTCLVQTYDSGKIVLSCEPTP